MGPGSMDFAFRLVGIVYGENQNFSFGAEAENLTHSGQTVQNWHVDIQDYQIGMKSLYFFDGVLSVGCFSADFKVGLSLQGVSNTVTEHFVVVGNQDAGYVMVIGGT